MTLPERIRINMNAADGYGRFADLGLTATHRQPPNPEDLYAVLASQVGRLFRLNGFISPPDTEVLLRINDTDGQTMAVENLTEPAFAGTYAVADEPPPQVTVHGDYLFDLVMVEPPTR